MRILTWRSWRSQIPREYAAMALRAMLVQRGVVVGGPAISRHRPAMDATSYDAELLSDDPCDAAAVAGQACALTCLQATPSATGELLASHTSAPLAEDVVLTNKVSQNLHAELLLHNLGRSAPCGDGSILVWRKFDSREPVACRA